MGAVIEVRARAPSPGQELAHMVPLAGLTVPGTGPRQSLHSLLTPGSSGNASLVLAQGMALVVTPCSPGSTEGRLMVELSVCV